MDTVFGKGDSIRIAGIFPAELKVKSIESAAKFCECLAKGVSVDFEDVNDDSMYYSIMKEKSGRVCFGHTKYGTGGDRLMAPPIMMDDSNVLKRVYQARASVNARFLNDE